MLAGEQEGERKGAVQPSQGRCHRLSRRQSLFEKMRRYHRDRLGVGIGAKNMAELLQLAPQSLEILDDAVVHDGNAVCCDRMSIGLGRQAVGRPPGVADTDHPLHRVVVEPPGEIDELAFGAPTLDAAIDESGDAGRIVAAIFEPAQPFEEARRHDILGDDADYAAHQLFFPRSRFRISVARPGLSTCWPRAIASASADTSRMTTLPAAT